MTKHPGNLLLSVCTPKCTQIHEHTNAHVPTHSPRTLMRSHPPLPLQPHTAARCCLTTAVTHPPPPPTPPPRLPKHQQVDPQSVTASQHPCCTTALSLIWLAQTTQWEEMLRAKSSSRQSPCRATGCRGVRSTVPQTSAPPAQQLSMWLAAHGGGSVRCCLRVPPVATSCKRHLDLWTHLSQTPSALQ